MFNNIKIYYYYCSLYMISFFGKRGDGKGISQFIESSLRKVFYGVIYYIKFLFIYGFKNYMKYVYLLQEKYKI